ncbi:hypothetical protein OGAPHI_001204, partial [Ogataea philodendri]
MNLTAEVNLLNLDSKSDSCSVIELESVFDADFAANFLRSFSWIFCISAAVKVLSDLMTGPFWCLANSDSEGSTFIELITVLKNLNMKTSNCSVFWMFFGAEAVSPIFAFFRIESRLIAVVSKSNLLSQVILSQFFSYATFNVEGTCESWKLCVRIHSLASNSQVTSNNLPGSRANNTKASSPFNSTPSLSSLLKRAPLAAIDSLIQSPSESIDITVVQINSIIESHPDTLLDSFTKYLLDIIFVDPNSSQSSREIAIRTLKDQIQIHVFPDGVAIKSFASCVCEFLDSVDNCSLTSILEKTGITGFFAVFATLAIEAYFTSNKSSTSKDLSTQFAPVYRESLPGLVDHLNQLKSNSNLTEPQALSYGHFLEYFLESKVFTAPHKLLIIDYLTTILDRHDNSILNRLIHSGIQNYYKDLSKMEFRQVLEHFEPSKLLPNKMLSDLLGAQSPSSLDDAVALILSEVLYPGSQKLCGQYADPITALTPSSVPEATARGAQLATILGRLKTQPNWQDVFNLVFQKTATATSMTQASLSGLLSSLGKDNLIDLFLFTACKTSNPQLLKDLLIQLNSLDPNQGAINLFEHKLEPVLSAEVNSRNLLLYFKSIVKVEVKAIALLQNEKINDSIVSNIFARDYRAAPEYIVLACLYILNDEPEAKENDLIINIMQNFVVSLLDVSSPYLGAIFTKFEEFNPVELGKLLVKYYEVRKTTDSIHKIASLTASFKRDTVIMSILSNSGDFKDAFSFAIIFSQYGWKRFQEFVLTQLDRNIAVVAGTIIDFMESQATLEYESAQQGHRLGKSLNLETVYFLMTTLGNRQIPTDLFEKFRNLQALCLQAYPRLINFGQGHDNAILMNSSTNTFSIDVEKEMKVYYQKMYNKEIEIKDIINMLQRLKVSDNPHDQDVFACMIHSLLDEYRFFPEYPVDALATTSVLFGSTILFRLVEGPALSIALRYIIDSVRQPPESKMFKFAIQALYSFMKRLGEFPKFCAMISEVPALQSQPQLYEACKTIASGGSLPIVSPQSTTASVSTPREKSKELDPSMFVSKFASIQVPVDILNDVRQETPASEVLDRVLFMVNNLTDDNATSRLTELKDLLASKYFEWFSNYLVNQRAKLEPNYHSLYGKIAEYFDSSLFDAHLLRATFQQIVLLLNKARDAGDSEDTADALSSTERSHLKNLGSWLGRLTLTRNKPIQHKYLSFKGLLIEAFDHKKLEIVIPFVCKVLDQTKSSKVFEYPSPWLVGILQTLKELYDVAGLKLNLKFEVEVVCNSLKVELSSIEPSTIIRNHKPGELERFIESQKMITKLARMSLDDQKNVSHNLGGVSLPGMGQSVLAPPQAAQQQLNVLQQLQQQRLLAAAQQQQSELPGAQASFDSPAAGHISTANQAPQPQQQTSSFESLNGNSVFVTHPNLRRLFQFAITKAVREILPPVVSRTNSVALVTTKSLVLKDFAFEVDELKLRKAYINTVRHLSESLTHASCRDLLRENIQLNLDQYISSLGQQIDPAILEDLPRAINDNLDLACSIIQKAAMEKSVQDLDEMMLPSIALRRQFRDSRPDQAFCDTQHASRYSMSLPDPLGIKPNGVTAKQFTIYNEFGKPKSAINPSGIPSSISTPAGVAAGVANEAVATPPALNAGVDQAALAQRVLQMQAQAQAQRLSGTAQARPTGVPDPAAQISVDQTQKTLEQSFLYIQQLFEAIVKSTEESQDKEMHLREISVDNPLRSYLADLIQILSRLNHNELQMKFAQLIMNALFSAPNTNQLLIEALIFLLDKSCELSSYVAKFVTTWLINSEDVRKYNKKIMGSLVQVGMISLSDLDLSISRALASKKDEQILTFASEFATSLIFGATPVALRSDFQNTISAIQSLDNGIISKNTAAQELLKRLDGKTELKGENFKTLISDPSKLKDYFAYVFAEWVKLQRFGDSSKKLHLDFLNGLYDQGILSKPDQFVLFFTTAMEMSVLSFVKESDNSKKLAVESYTAIDAFAELLIQLIVIQEDHSSSRLNFFKSALSVVLLVFAHDHEMNKANFNERPYFRFFSTLLCNWNSLNHGGFTSVADDEGDVKKLKNFHVKFYQTLADFFLALQPDAFPGFTFAWVCLISHRMFLPVILELEEDAEVNKAKFASLLVSLLRFESIYVKDSYVLEAVSVVYKGTLRVFAVLLHDFPEFLVEAANVLVSAMPASFVQLRNIVLSAAPRRLEIPDPFQPGLKVDRLPDIIISPPVMGAPGQLLQEKNVKKVVDTFLRVPSAATAKQIISALELAEPVAEAGIGFKSTKYNTKLINALVLYVCMGAMDERVKNGLSFNPKSTHVTILSSLMQEGTVELQFLLLQSIANNLRYPNAHTHWFSCVILQFFGSSTLWGQNLANVQQLITRVLLERIICNKPHPWGLLVTFT